jgi:hypothetical protein
MKRIILIALVAVPLYPNTQQTITIQPNLMPLVVAFMQKHGKLPNPEEMAHLQNQADNAVEQAKFATVIGACASGITTTLMTGNPLPAIASICGAVAPLIGRNPQEATSCCDANSSECVSNTSNCSA